MENKKFDFIIVDGDSYIHRAYHGYKKYNRFATEENFAIKGFLEMLSKTLNMYKSSYLAIVFDYQGPSFRNELSPIYKANRPKKEPIFLSQIEDIHNIIKKSGLPSFCIKGFEGDDTIGSLVRKAQLKKWNTAIFTGDKDLAQLLDENTCIIDTNTRTEKIIKLNDLEKYFGVEKPENIIDLLAIKGDKADNILGLNGCGDKTGVFLVKKYGTVENIIAADKDQLKIELKSVLRHKDKIESVLYQLEEDKERLLLDKELTKLKENIIIDLTLKDIKIKEERLDKNYVIAILKKYNLKKEFAFQKEIINLLN